MTTLRGLTWDHPRGHDPLACNAAAFAATHPGVGVTWERRSLKQFGDQPLDALADDYDLIMIDHPFVGRAARTRCLHDLALLAPDLVSACAADSAGPSAASYVWDGAVFALPTDAALQALSWRPDLLPDGPPQTHDAVFATAARLRAGGLATVTPLCPTDAICLLLTILANLGHPADDGCEALDHPATLEALTVLAALLALSVPQSLEWNPVQAYAAMTVGDDLALCPAAFGYSNYARAGQQRPLAFSPFPGPGADPVAGAILGGAGMAVTRSVRDVEAALAYMRFVHAPAHQAGPYFEAGGQPGLRSAWLSGAVDAACPGFFRATLPALDRAHVRARFEGMAPWLEASGRLVNQCLRGTTTRQQAATTLADTFATARDGDHP